MDDVNVIKFYASFNKSVTQFKNYFGEQQIGQSVYAAYSVLQVIVVIITPVRLLLSSYLTNYTQICIH